MSFRWKIAQAAEIRWWQNYLAKQQPKDYLAWKKNYWRNFLQDLQADFPLQLKGPILDAGAGPAGMFCLLQEDFPLTALDPLFPQYAAKLPHFEPAQYPNTQFIHQALEDFVQPAQFSTIFCLNAINHVQNWTLCLQNLIRSLAPGGQLILSTDIHRHAWLYPIFKLLPGDILHPQQHQLQHYLQALKAFSPSVLDHKRLKREAIFDYELFFFQKEA